MSEDEGKLEKTSLNCNLLLTLLPIKLPLDIVDLAQDLIYREDIPAAWLEVLKEINTAIRCDRGIEISDEQVNSAIEIGGQTLE